MAQTNIQREIEARPTAGSTRPRPYMRAWFLLPLLACAGCLISSGSRTEMQGREVSGKTLDQIEAGKGRDFVIALLGEPSTSTKLEGNGEIAKWEYKEVKTTRNAVFVIFSGRRVSERTGAVYVEFKNGRVVKTWRD
jgi:outer membrane protein assembly factor BamE (lipoprotein component of BamABCDE complex)